VSAPRLIKRPMESGGRRSALRSFILKPSYSPGKHTHIMRNDFWFRVAVIVAWGIAGSAGGLGPAL
jgi:hypothetical protein